MNHWRKALPQVVVLLHRQVHQRGDLRRDVLLPLERRGDGGFGGRKRRRRRRDRRNLQLPLGVEQVFHELHRVLALFFRLLEEETREQRELAALEMRGDADVLHAGAELVADLRVERLDECWTDHRAIIAAGAASQHAAHTRGIGSNPSSVTSHAR